MAPLFRPKREQVVSVTITSPALVIKVEGRRGKWTPKNHKVKLIDPLAVAPDMQYKWGCMYTIIRSNYI